VQSKHEGSAGRSRANEEHAGIRYRERQSTMSGIRTWALISGGIFGLMLVAIFAGGLLQSSGLVKNPAALETPAKIFFFTLFVLFGFSIIPLMVYIVLGVQVMIGHGNVGPVKAALDHAWWIIGALWLLIAAGLVVALPAAIRDGFFTSG
jgi:hypothetical protein